MIKKFLTLFLLYTILLFDVSANKIFSNYFQQKVDYTIEAKLDTLNNCLFVRATITYYNNSPITLDSLIFHLWANAFKDDRSALFKQMLQNGFTELYFADEKDKGGYDSIKFFINNKVIPYKEYQNNPDIIVIHLPEPIFSGESIELNVKYTLKIPKVFSRLGRINQDYYITQWYPKPAVFDSLGWHPMPYLEQGEFYSEFGNYKVKITIPSHFIVAATGKLVTESELEMWKFLSKCDDISTTKFFNSLKNKASSFKIIEFVADSVHDFAFFIGTNKMIRHEKAFLSSSKVIDCWSFFNVNNHKTWKNSALFIKKAIEFYSNKIGEYPYPQATAFQGNTHFEGGMEYPMITIIDITNDEKLVENVIVHEVGHNWFMGILANNERDYPWMDEAINTYYESRYMETYYNNNNFYNLLENNLWKISWETNTYQPPGLHSEKYSLFNYFASVYNFGSLSFKFLESYLGKDTFDMAMQSYFNYYKFKHVYPSNIKQIFEKTSKKDLNWFFDDLLHRPILPDYRIKKIKKTASHLKININNKGYQLPLLLKAYNKDSLILTKWFSNLKTNEIIIPTNDYSHISILEYNFTPEINKTNNHFFPKQIFPKLEKFKFKPFYSNNISYFNNIYFSPVFAYNWYGGFLTGILFYNHILPQRFEFEAIPFYGFKSSKIYFCGRASRYFNIDNKLIRQIIPKLNLKFFDHKEFNSIYLNYTKITPEISFLFKTNYLKKIFSQLTIRHNIIWESIINTDIISSKKYNTIEKNISELKFDFENNKIINPFSLYINLQNHQNFTKLFSEYNYSITLSKNKSIDIRLFAGTFIRESKDYYGNYNFRMSSWNNFHDYLYDHNFVARNVNHGIWARQTVRADGGFKVPTFVGNSNNWLITTNFEWDIPGILPIRLFADFGTYHRAGKLYSGSEYILYDAGFIITLFNFNKITKGFFEIYIPLLYSKEIKRVAELNKIKWEEMITFSLNIKKFDIFKHIRKIQYIHFLN